MLTRDIFGLSLHNLLLHKVRSILTSLGVIFGVGSVIAMLSISEGAKQKALAQIEAMGIDKIIVYSKKPPIAGKDSGKDNNSMTERFGLENKDLKHIKRMDNIDRITAMRDGRKKILKGLQRLDLKLIGVGRTFLEDSSSTIIKGRWLAVADFTNKRQVCVIGKNVKRKFFSLGERQVIGKFIRIEGQLLRIIGILDNDLGTQYPELGSPNNMIFMPMATSKALFGNYAFTREGRSLKIINLAYDLLIVKIMDLTQLDNTSKRISAYLRKSHAKVKDWDILVPLDLLKQREHTQNIFTIVMSSIAGISLVVGGIGIMNIMLANVYERRKEIGTRRALGAQKSDILLQFLIETVFLTTMGGLIGIAVGIALSQIITYYADMPTVYLWWSIVVSMVISSLVGVIFGTYPAWKAAQQNPIEVLRAE